MMADDDTDLPVNEEGLPEVEEAEEDVAVDAVDAFDEFGNPIDE